MSIRCLVVDDDSLARLVLQHFIAQDADLELLRSCATAAEAEEALRGANVDLLFLDVELEETTGFALLATVAQPPPVILVTGRSVSAEEARAAGAIDTLEKPVSYQRFRTAVARAKQGRAPEPESGPDFAGFAGRFLAERRLDLVRITELLDAGDLDAIGRLGHRMKGTGAMFGFPEIGETGRRLEAAARANRTDDVSRLATELRDLVEGADR